MIEKANIKENFMKKTVCIFLSLCLSFFMFFSGNTYVYAESLEINAPSAILVEAKTGTVIYEKNPDEIRSPASITKIMTMLLAFEALEEGKIHLEDEVVTSAYAKSMGGSQVFLEEGEVQTVDTLLKCIAVASGNDASVCIAEHIGGTEGEFVNLMNAKAKELGMNNTQFVDCCGLSNSDEHYTTARDVSIMSRELITKYPQVFDYTTIWMEDITHVTSKGESTFTLSSTNKLLKQYPYANGLKTGSTDKAKYCLSATALKEDVQLIAVVMAAPDYKVRFEDCQNILNYGFAKVHFYEDERKENIAQVPVRGGVDMETMVEYKDGFVYLDMEGNDLSRITKEEVIPEFVEAPLKKGDKVGTVNYYLGEEQIGMVDIVICQDLEKAGFTDYFKRGIGKWLLGTTKL